MEGNHYTTQTIDLNRQLFPLPEPGQAMTIPLTREPYIASPLSFMHMNQTLEAMRTLTNTPFTPNAVVTTPPRGVDTTIARPISPPLSSDEKEKVIVVKGLLDELSAQLVESLGRQLPLHNAFFAGGCIRDLLRDTAPKDYDIFFSEKEDMTLVNEYFTANPANVERTSLGNWNLTVQTPGGPIICQFITCFYGPAKNMVGVFDYTVNSSYYVIASEEMFVHKDSFGKELIPLPKIARPLNALCRLEKFILRGYTIQPTSIVRIVEQIRGKPFTKEEIGEGTGWGVSG